MPAGSPLIDAFAWGKIEVGGVVHKDAKLFPGGHRAWDWNETGTRHRPGTQPADAQELLDRGADVVVLTRGVQLVLQVPPETVDVLRGKGVEVHVLQSEEAVAVYNDLARAGRAVGGLFHSTC